MLRHLNSTKILAALCLILFFRAAPSVAQENEDCLACHGETDLAVEDEKGETVSLYVDRELFESSSHGAISCTDCHSDLELLDHPGQDTPVKKVDCRVCHEEMAEIYQTSIHGQLLEEIESLPSRLESVKLGPAENETIRAAWAALDLFAADGSKGVHNSVMAEEHLSRVLSNLKKLLSAS